MKILLHYDTGPAWRRRLAALASERGLDVICCPESDDAQLHRLLPEVEVIWHVLRPLSASDISLATRLKLIHKFGTGVNTIDLDAARAAGVAVCNMPGANARAVAEMTILLMLASLRRLPMLNRATVEGRGWNLGPALLESLGELGGRTVGLVGFGAIPRMLTPMLQAFGARVLYTATTAKPGVEIEYRRFPDLLRESDILSLHAPLTGETTGMIGEAQFRTMKRGAILINTARGALVDRDALVAALRDGSLAAAGLDVYAQEPIDPSDPLLKLENVVATPHVAWMTSDVLAKCTDLGIEACRRLLTGEPLPNRVI